MAEIPAQILAGDTVVFGARWHVSERRSGTKLNKWFYDWSQQIQRTGSDQ
jgi:hypothetical protein